MHDHQDLQGILDHIEAHLDAPLSIAALADRAGYSRWHFQRVFAAVTGQSPAGYIRARRLSEAARRLRESEGILPLALRYGFESQAAFTRAFRQYFGMPPGAAREAGVSLILQPPLQLKPSSGGPMLNPEFVTEPVRRLIGLKTRFNSAMSPAANNLEVIPALWDQLIPRMGEIAASEREISLGVIYAEPGSEAEPDCESELSYFAGLPVADATPVPAGMQALSLPGGLYARFTHTGPLSEIRETMRQIYAEWVPTSGYALDQRPDLEVYDSRFRPDLGQTTFDVLIPIKEK